MAIDERLSLNTYKGQRAAVQDLFQQYIGGEIDHEIVKGATTLIREARLILQAEKAEDKKATPVQVNSIKTKPTPHGPFPRLIKPE